MHATCGPNELFAWVDDLRHYPSWLSVVSHVTPEPGDERSPAWLVELRGRLGLLARSKRLRMVRTAWQPGQRVVFERAELDGRRHSAWVLTAEVRPADGGADLSMHLHYGGSLWGPVLERLLGEEVERGQARLGALVAAGPPPIGQSAPEQPPT
jgi:Polyketide cyclase / dehydrase and lipid transport